MILNKIKLEGIRSYASGEISFPEGSVLLSGNVGSGKSSVLLALDFALFGIQRGVLSGTSLLRQGLDFGSVEAHLKIKDAPLIIKRTLKRTKTGASQEAGFIVTNGDKHEGTAEELRERVFQLLNYPKTTRDKSLIFRYTVYTPQEEMKRILLGNAEERLDILRKVFGIDKYKRIKDNCRIVCSRIKEKKKVYQGIVSGLPEKESQFNKKEEEYAALQGDYAKLLPLLQDLNDMVNKGKEEIACLEGEIEKQRAIAKELAIAETEYQAREPAIASKNLEIGLLKNEVTLLEKENLCIKEGLQQLINKKAVMLKSHEENMFAFRDKIQHIKTLVHEAGNLKSKISTLDRCPTCEQPVTAEYKKKIADSADAKITLFEKDGLDFNEKLACSQGIVDALRQEIKGLEREQAEQEVILLKIKAKEEKKGLLEKNGKLIESLTKEKSELEHRIAQLKKEEEHFARTEHEYKNKKEAYESVCFRQREAELKAGILKANIKNIEDMLSLLKREIKDKKNAESKMQGLAKLQSWLESGFSGLIEAIEISIMGKIHAGFNSMFQNWFRKLIEDENISVNIDETFTPRVTISLHDIDYDYLSGGERTAVALAYRLALNQAINEIITSINTREILILDEPTEGFSSAQIDSMKDIFKAINVKQLIIVSHEPRLESFVDDVIRFEKAENRTRVYY